jgi:hypothetical protein
VKFRAAIVACYFEGKTLEEAADQLSWPRGTVASRLARGREMLRRRLLRRGVSLTVNALLAALAVRNAQAALTGLVNSVFHTARLLAAGQAVGAVVSPHVAALAEGVLQAMYWTRMKIVVVGLILAGLGGAGVTLWAYQAQNQTATPNRDKPELEELPRKEKARPEIANKQPALAEIEKEDLIRIGDLLNIRVTNALPGDRIQGIVQVEPSGKVALGSSYGRVNIKGLTLEEAEKTIHKLLSKMVKDPGSVLITRPIPENPALDLRVQLLESEVKTLRAEIESLKKYIRPAGNK